MFRCAIETENPSSCSVDVRWRMTGVNSEFGETLGAIAGIDVVSALDTTEPAIWVQVPPKLLEVKIPSPQKESPWFPSPVARKICGGFDAELNATEPTVVCGKVRPVGEESSTLVIKLNVLPPSEVIHKPPPAVPTKSLPDVVGSVAIDVTWPVAGKVHGDPPQKMSVPPKLACTPWMGCGPRICQAGLDTRAVPPRHRAQTTNMTPTLSAATLRRHGTRSMFTPPRASRKALSV